MRRRVVVQLFESTSAVGGTVETNFLDVEEFDEVVICIAPAGAAAGVFNAYAVSEKSAQFMFGNRAGIGAGQFWWYTLGFTAPPNTDANVVLEGGPPVPRQLRVTGPAGAGGTVTLLVYGVKYEES